MCTEIYLPCLLLINNIARKFLIFNKISFVLDTQIMQFTGFTKLKMLTDN